MRKPRKFSIRRGDVWDLRTNYGVLRRIVKSVACGVVSYQNAEGQFCQCLLSTFKQWAWAAELSSADNWANRDSSGNDVPKEN